MKKFLLAMPLISSVLCLIGTNLNFFDTYGRLDDVRSELAKSQFLFVRHGVTIFNKWGYNQLDLIQNSDLSS
jgi:hypothetical protein